MIHVFRKIVLLTMAAVFPGLDAAVAGESDSPLLPNIVVILADDMGYGDVQAFNESSTIPTPNLNRLASDGLAFTDAHTPSSVCTPTRYGLVTGRYCWRTRLKSGVLSGSSRHLIDPDRKTLADVVRERGYDTGVVGKWHLGLDWQHAGTGEGRKVDYDLPVDNGPAGLGFDFSYLVPASLDMPPYAYVRNGRVVELPTMTQQAIGFPAYVRKGSKSPSFIFAECLDHLLRQARDYIRERSRAEKPFFLYFPLTAPHKPVLPHPRFRGRTKLGPYGDFIVQVDSVVGQLLETLEKAGVSKNTLVFFTSDNGSFMFRLDASDAEDHVDKDSIQAFRADRHTSNYVFRGTKADIWEGGHHVPFLVRWPGVVRPGSRRDETICLTDILATVAEVVGAGLDANVGEDSYSFLPLLRGEDWKTPRPPVVHHSINGMFALRAGKWKLIVGNGSGGRESPKGKPFGKPYKLLDLSRDIRETNDLAEKEPEVVERLTQALEKIRSSGRSVSR